MPLLDLNLAVVVDQHGQPSVHLTIDTKWLSFSNVQHARALKNLAPCIESDKTEDGEPVFLYNEVTGVALTITGAIGSPCLDTTGTTFPDPEGKKLRKQI